MEQPPMFMDQQNQHCENGYTTTESNLQIQCDPHQNFNVILHRCIKINPKIHIDAQKTPNSQSILKQRSNDGDITILQSHSSKISMVLTAKQT
jgi:hypothetical protein